MANYYVDFVGLNTFIYEPVGWDEDEFENDFFGSFEQIYGPLARPALLIDHGRKSYVSQNTIGIEIFRFAGSEEVSGLWKTKNYLFYQSLATSASFFPALMLRRNGPYGYNSFKQIRVSENPLSRKQRKENVFTFVTEPGDEVVINNNGKVSTIRNKYGAIQKFTENPVTSRYKPFIVGGASIIGDGTLERFEAVASYGNETIFFNNEEINKYNSLRVLRSSQYNTLKDFYLNGGLDADGSPIDSFEFFKYRECVYPPRIYQYKNYVRQRTAFSFPWRDDRTNRTELLNSNDGFVSKGTSQYQLNFASHFLSQSVWPLDGNNNFSDAFITGSEDRMTYYGKPFDIATSIQTKDFGVLQNTWTSFSPSAGQGPSFTAGLFGPLYARKHMQTTLESCISPNGMNIAGVNVASSASFGDIPANHLPCGEVKWEAPAQSGLAPFYDTYDNYIQDVRQYGKDYTIIPEFRISDHVETFITKGSLSEVDSLFSLTGALLNTADSSKSDFYKIYSTSEFMKHFEIIKRDHKEFVSPHSLTLKCKAIKKLLPYDGFYPAQRSVDLAKQFVDSYSTHIVTKRKGDDTIYKISNGFQALMQTLFAPGVLYNSIKSGVACDYPIINSDITSQLTAISAQGQLVMPKPVGGINSGISDDGVYYGDWVHNGFSNSGIGTFPGVGDDKFRTNAFAIQVPSGTLPTIGNPGHTELRLFHFVQSGAFGGISNGQTISDSTFTGGNTNGYQNAVVVNATSSYNDVRQAISGAIAIVLSGSITTEFTDDGITLFQAPGQNGNIADIIDLGFNTNPAISSNLGWQNLNPSTLNNPDQLSTVSFRGGTDAVYALNNSSSSGFSSGSIFDQRIPFEAIVEPEKYLSDNFMFFNEPHPSGNVGMSCNWDGQGNQLYKLMANNFTAEVSSFFLKNQQNSTILSKPSSDPNVGNATAGRKYRMRIKMFKTSDRRTPTRPMGSTVGDAYYQPQFSSNEKENFTMYSRPSAFGPECLFYSSSLMVHNPSQGENYPFSPPYYYGESWADVLFEPTETRKYSIEEMISLSSVEYYRYLEDTTTGTQLPSNVGSQSGVQFLNTVTNNNAMQINSSVNLFSQLREREKGLNVTINSNNSPSRWAIQTKFETPMLNFNHLSLSSSITLPTEGSASTARGMWHQYGLIEENPEKGVFLQVTNVPHNFRKQLLSEDLEDQFSLVDLCGFSTDSVKLGMLANEKKISEAVIAIPFIEEDGDRKFFRIPRIDIQRALGSVADRELVGDSILKMITKMQKYVFPPSFDFIKNNTVDPFAMYIFEFSHNLSKQDLANIWQNLYPQIGHTFDTSESSITHELLAHELLGGGAQLTPEGTLDFNTVGNELPDRVRWMVFKVKQKAQVSYYNKIIDRSDDTDFDVAVTPEGTQAGISYNWPYDFFSLVELAKIESEVKFAEKEIKPGQEPRETIVPKVSRKAGTTRGSDEIRTQGRAAGQAIRQRRQQNVMDSVSSVDIEMAEDQEPERRTVRSTSGGY